jgi:hypothetical protein
VFGRVYLRHLCRIKRKDDQDDISEDMQDVAEMLHKLYGEKVTEARPFAQIVFAGCDAYGCASKEERKKLKGAKIDRKSEDYVEMVMSTNIKVFLPL